ncbi:hypothetical protein KIN20_029149 [Parelaphostrongylus tenuis]|uniref:Steroid dehydrogenase n=1 Tax=Parelaphostrongylus tenuis TaxID=148309 RepID=A0AAD5R1V9_PARTN|nr:hypothetical protein KIN20_029149 [Parelaphostrongylus tenuis]
MLNILWSCCSYAFTSYLVVRLLKFLFIIAKCICVHILTPVYNLDHLKDSWTVVTGGTDGIGRAYIEELAKSRGIRKFYLIGRNRQKLETVVKEMEIYEFESSVAGGNIIYALFIEQIMRTNIKGHSSHFENISSWTRFNFFTILVGRYDAICKTAVFDFEYDDYSNLPQELRTLDVGILINCAGIAPNQVGNFVELPEQLATKILRVNLMSNVKMIEYILPGMIQRNKGCVVNISSMTGWRPLPYLSTYPASKAAIAFFSDSLSDEFRHTNVRIQCLIPLLVATKASSYETTDANNLFIISPENYAKQAVRAIGRFEILTGCIQHDIQIAFGTLISFWLFKQFYVPLVMLGIHKDRIASFQKKHQKQN